MIRLAAAVSAVLFAAPALASGRCTIHNETGYSFTIESGDTSNQRVGGHTETTIDAGKIIAKSDEGKAAGGHCNDGDRIKIVEEDGAVMIMPQ